MLKDTLAIAKDHVGALSGISLALSRLYSYDRRVADLRKFVIDELRRRQ